LKRAKTQTSVTRALVTAAQWSIVVNDFSITLFLEYMSLSRQNYSLFDADYIWFRGATRGSVWLSWQTPLYRR